MQKTFQRFDDIVLVGKPFFMAIMDIFGLFVLCLDVSVDFCHCGIPLLLGEGILARIVYIKNKLFHLGKLTLPCGVDSAFEGK